ncbi:Kae1-associated kinase Bud32 [archaeon]|nr:Kae1-associated kinase Bud32 [archaeon]
MKDIIKIGAEAVLYKKNSQTLVKERVKKSYRLSDLDETLRKRRTRREAKVLQKTNANVPNVSLVDDKTMLIEMEFINGDVVRDVLDASPNQKKICTMIGEQIATIHNEHIIHGDLTTSNMMLQGEKLVLIDFGLAFFSHKVEDKAVDLRLLKQALESKHYKHAEVLIEDVLASYLKKSDDGDEVLKRLEKVENRGRYKRKGKGS